ncbi:DUF389 domain-containing protein [Flavobacterium sp. LMO8]|uniref:DUF389 domain-containing protein n=1 Tax=Flavobacterium sp. LMO8 TaxID=2654244 RepID=UPI001291D04F|nr:DUF389 domain-containing protein [Flavobacterium sp. LMO8]MQP23981.1 DUF389 domain-containing protein [Flavobacterium sp. LMO8]
MDVNEEKSTDLIRTIKFFLKETFNIIDDTDVNATIEDIKAGVPIKGQTAWVLIFSILIASAGLNTSSTAVVIGAMLISPLMGPIMGIGLSLGINDIFLLRKAVKNFGIMVGLSLITSFLYFSIPVFQNETPELIARTGPDVRDVIIAFAGGLALIIAFSRRSKAITTISGVAIATALMPPLCTAGFGLATGKWHFFGGAMFLFSINTIFIATATFIIVRFLKFPFEQYLDSKRKKIISNVIYISAFVILVPSVFFFYKLYKQSDFNQTISHFIQDQKEKNGVLVFDIEKDYSKQEISFAIIGNKINEKDLTSLKSLLKYKGYDNVKINVIKNYQESEGNKKLNNDEKILLTSQKIANNQYPIAAVFESISKEIHAIDTNIVEVSYGRILKSNFNLIDTIPTFYIKWKDETENVESENNQIQNWLRVKTENSKLKVQAIQ